MKFSKGTVSLSLVIGLVIMAIVLPLVGGLALKNQDNRNRAAGRQYCPAGYYLCKATACCANVVPTKSPTRCTSSSQCSAGYICSSSGKCTRAIPTATRTCKCISGFYVGDACGTLLDKRCETPTVATKKSNGSSCNSPIDCQSGSCYLHKCVACNGGSCSRATPTSKPRATSTSRPRATNTPRPII